MASPRGPSFFLRLQTWVSRTRSNGVARRWNVAIISSLNRILCRTGGPRSFFSCCYFLFERDGTFLATVAGHPQIVKIAGNPSPLPISGVPGDFGPRGAQLSKAGDEVTEAHRGTTKQKDGGQRQD